MQDLFFKIGATPQSAYAMRGQLYLSETGWLLLRVPNAVMRGVFATLNEPGVQLPPGPRGAPNAHISVMMPAEVKQIGAANITERGRDFSYTLGPLRTIPGTGALSKIWYISVRSPELNKLRRSYGLPGRPGEDREFHVTVAVRKKNVLGDTEVTKLDGTPRAFAAVMDGGEPAGSRLFKVASFAAALLRARMIKEGRSGHARKHTRNGDSGSGDRSTPGENGAGGPRSCALSPGPGAPGAGGNGHSKTGTADTCVAAAQHAAERGVRTSSDTAATATAAPAGTVPVGAGLVKVALSLKQQIATAARRVAVPASASQADAGNYRKGHVKVHGLDIAIETAAGQRRSPDWPPLKHSYGYVKRTEGSDGDHVDVFLGPDPDVELVYVVDQVDPDTRRFDEHKCLIGFRSLEDARAGYLANYADGWRGSRDITPLTVQQFKAWLKDGDTTKAIAKQTFTIKASSFSDRRDLAGPVGLALGAGPGIQLVLPVRAA